MDLELLLGLLELLAEPLLQIVFELLADMGLHRLYRRRQPLHVRARPLLMALAYMSLGSVAGLVSIVLFPKLAIREEWARWRNLLVTPILAGSLMAWIGQQHGRERTGIERFSYGALFALAMALTRLVLAARGSSSL